jgi:hypothetical protein
MVARDTEYDPLILNGREDTMASRKDSFSPGLTVLPSQKKQKPSTAAEDWKAKRMEYLKLRRMKRTGSQKVQPSTLLQMLATPQMPSFIDLEENGAKSDSPLLSDHSSMSHDDTGSLEDLSTGSSPDPCSGDSIFLSLSATKNKEPIKRRRHKVIPVYHHYVMSQEVFTVQTPAKQEVIVKDMLSDYEVPVEHVINTSVLAYDPATYWDGQSFECPPLSSDNTASMCTTSSVSDIGSHCDIAGLMGTTIATSNTSFDYCAPPPPYGVMCPRSEHQMMSAQNTPSCTTSLPCDIGLLTAHTPASNVNGISTTSITSPCGGGDTPSIPITSAYNVGNSFDMPFTSDQYCYNTRPPQNGYHQMPPYSTYAPHSGIGTHL